MCSFCNKDIYFKLFLFEYFLIKVYNNGSNLTNHSPTVTV